jgi:hypothetical protein
MLEKLVMSGDFVGRTHPDTLADLRYQSVFILGESMFDEMARLASAYLNAGVKRLVIMTGSEASRKAVEAKLESAGVAAKPNGLAPHPALALLSDPGATAMGGALDKAVAQFGNPNVVVSFPMGFIAQPPLAARHAPAWENLPTTAEFKTIVEQQLTNHLVIARRASTLDDCRVIFVTPRLPERAAPQAVAMANFVRTTLRPLTVTAGQEGARLIHKPVFNQIDVQSDTAKFTEAALLMSLPPATAAEPKGATKSSPGTTITV